MYKKIPHRHHLPFKKKFRFDGLKHYFLAFHSQFSKFKPKNKHKNIFFFHAFQRSFIINLSEMTAKKVTL